MPSTFETTTIDTVRLLSDPGTYSDGTLDVEVIETHISWVFLTKQFAYKLKKPLSFEFLDFTTLGSRRTSCYREVIVNQIFSQSVYLGIEPVTRQPDGSLKLSGSGRIVDFVLKMRRLPAELALDHLIRHRRCDEATAESVVPHLLDLYARLPRADIVPADYYGRQVEHCHANRAVLLSKGDPRYSRLIRRVHTSQLLFIWLHESLFTGRLKEGRVVCGHGDLRAEHIYLESPTVLIDAIEFSDELRQVDILDDFCFLAMDCAELGNSQVAERLFAGYERLFEEHPPALLLAFYKSYRACVRAKVAVLRLEQVTTSGKRQLRREVHRHLQWADHYVRELERPILFVIGGLMGTGKSTLAGALAEVIACDVVSTDHIRRQLAGASRSPSDYGKGNYTEELRTKVYDRLIAKAGETLDHGVSVVMDGTFLTNKLRSATQELAVAHGARHIFVECQCPKSLSLARMYQRTRQGEGFSEARPDLYDVQRSQREELDERYHCIPISSVDPIDRQLSGLASELLKR